VCSWNGTKLNTAGFSIESDNGMKVKHSVDSLSPVGMTMGRFKAVLTLKTWIDDDFVSRFVPDYLGSGVSVDTTGTFEAVISGNTVTTGTEIELFTGTIHLQGKIVEIPNANPKKDGIQQVKLELTSPEAGSAWDEAGYYIKIDSRYHDWQSVT
ncbi:MAG: hypothetical protein KAU20_00365, partial [Nanoarchaeota archaeon]|nr:hypothetical protein [Nanoarchaeota archaeon]